MQIAADSRSPAVKAASLLDELPTSAAAILTVVAVGALAFWTLATEGSDPGGWDYLFVSGCLTTLAGLWLARGHAARFDAMFERLLNRSVLESKKHTDKELVALKETVRVRTLRWSTWGGVVAGVLIGVAWIVVNASRDHDPRLFEAIAGPAVGALAAFLVGRILGRMAAYGLLGPFLQGKGVRFAPSPGHVDGAAGLKPLGDYYLYQALLLALPAVFLLFWSFMLALPEWDRRYEGWRETYLGLLAAAILLELLAFVAPMWQAHVAMADAKRKERIKLDTTVAKQIADARAELERPLTDDRRKSAQDRLDRLTARYEAVETMPTWPIDRGLRRRVTLGNAALLLGLLGQVTALTGWS